ncbi:MAG: hypothetical protein JWP18_677, partial [Solirubrobacterales bacterium]|nr:hypothetical protein [Solirubrobacterales bacterium]
MLALVASAGFIAFGALFLGQCILRLCGTPRWTWTAAPIGVVAMMLIAIPALHTPGRAKTTAVVLLVAVAVSVVVTLRSPAHRPPLVGLFSGLPVAAMAAIPFLSTGTAGTLGWSFNNDMATHLLWADGYR